MVLSFLSITDFRNLAQVELHPLTTGFNFLYGKNGSGKTSFLEAIYYLGHRRSFRSLNAAHLIRYLYNRFCVFGKINDQHGQMIPLGIERLQQGECRIRADGQDIATISELAAFLPIRLINVHSHYLLEGSPAFRRKYLDWGMFYQNKEFHAVWFRFRRLLKQRNAALRRKALPRELAGWTQQLAEAGALFHQLRLTYIEQLLPILQDILTNNLSAFFKVADLQISYQPGWDTRLNYGEALAASISRDIERGTTQYGPHRADLSLCFNDIPAKDVLSTGQQKLLVCGMIVAQGILLEKQVHKTPIYLIDDLPAELDVQSRRWLLNTLADQKAQVFVTAVEAEAMSELLAQMEVSVKMFHVKQGSIQETDSIVPRETKQDVLALTTES